MRRIIHACRHFYLDSSNGAAVANRALIEGLSRYGYMAEALCGTVVNSGTESDPLAIICDLDPGCLVAGNDVSTAWIVGTPGVTMSNFPYLRGVIHGVPVTVPRRLLRRSGKLDTVEASELLSLFEATLDRFCPDVMVTYGGDLLTLEMLARARQAGVATVFTLHNFGYPDPDHFRNVDAVVVPSRFSADYHRQKLKIECVALPCLVDGARVRARDARPSYVTFVNASVEKGVYAFARIADELGRLRPDIPLLVVESRGTESTLVECGLDLRRRGNTFLMSQTSDPRDFWGVTKVCLMPSLWWESQGLVAVEAMLNGVPVIASDRGALPETLGTAGVILSLPARLTPTAQILPTAQEVSEWVETIIRLWDDEALYAEHQSRALAQSAQWHADVLLPRFASFLNTLTAKPVAESPDKRS